MGMTMTQKILAAHAGLSSVEAGQLIEADLDLVLGNDITSPVAIHEMDGKMNAYFVTCTDYLVDESGKVTEIHCTYDPETKSGTGFTGRKVKGTIHWVYAPCAVKTTARLYENLIDEEKGVYNEEDGSMNLNPDSITVLENCYVEPMIKEAKAYDRFQFLRNGFFCVDYKDSTKDHLVFNRIVSLKSSYKPN